MIFCPFRLSKPGVGTIFPQGQRPYEVGFFSFSGGAGMLNMCDGNISFCFWLYHHISPLSHFGTAFGLKPLVNPQYAQLAAHDSSNRMHGANVEYQYQWPCKIRPSNGILMGVSIPPTSMCNITVHITVYCYTVYIYTYKFIYICTYLFIYLYYII